MPNYEKCVIYKLCCKDTDIKECYIGSTCNYSRRKAEHKSKCNNENDRAYNFKVYQVIRDNGGWDNWDFVIIEKYPCKDKIEKEIRERYWVELIGTLNARIPNRTHKEYYDNNKEKILESCKEYRENNKEEIKQTKKEYYKNNKDKIAEIHKEYYINNKEKITESGKNYRENNKEKIAKYHKEYKDKNKDKIKEQQKEYREKNNIIYKCITCDKNLTLANKAQHKKSKTHIKNLSK